MGWFIAGTTVAFCFGFLWGGYVMISGHAKDCKRGVTKADGVIYRVTPMEASQ